LFANGAKFLYDYYAVDLSGSGSDPKWARVDGAVFVPIGTPSQPAVKVFYNGLISNSYFDSSTAGGVELPSKNSGQAFVYGCTFKGIVLLAIIPIIIPKLFSSLTHYSLSIQQT